MCARLSAGSPGQPGVTPSSPGPRDLLLHQATNAGGVWRCDPRSGSPSAWSQHRTHSASNLILRALSLEHFTHTHMNMNMHIFSLGFPGVCVRHKMNSIESVCFSSALFVCSFEFQKASFPYFSCIFSPPCLSFEGSVSEVTVWTYVMCHRRGKTGCFSPSISCFVSIHRL